MRARTTAMLVLSTLLAPGLGRHAQAQAARPASAHRVVQHFDFEERAFTTEPVPPHWVRLVNVPGRVARPGFPPWNESGFDGEHAFAGAYSVRIPTRGGSAALRLAAGVVPVVPEADYTVSAMVRTDGLHRARAQLIARFLDADLKQIAASQQSTSLIRTSGAWERVQVELWGDFPDAAWVQIDLLLLQPTEQPGHRETGDADLETDDLHGSVWFDEVSIVQYPRVELTTNSATNVVLTPEKPTLRVRVRDLTGEALRGEIEIRDVWGRVVSTHTVGLPPGAPVIEWAPPLTRLGWYEVTLRAVSEAGTVGQTSLTLVWSRGQTPEPADNPRMTLIAEHEPLEQLAGLPGLTRAAAAGGVLVALPNIDAARFLPPLESAVMALLERHVRVALQLGRLPDALARTLHIATDDVLAIPLDEESGAWTTFLEPALARFGQRVNQWQVGEVGDDYAERPLAQSRRDEFYAAFSRLSPEPVIAVPWSAYAQIDRTIGAQSYSVALPPAVQPEGIHDLVSAWDHSAPGADITLTLENPAQVPAPARLRGLAWRVLHAWETSATRLAVRAPWTWSTERRPSPRPAPELAALRTLSWELHGRRVIGRVPTPAGAFVFILSGPRGDALVGWNEYADPKEAVLDVSLGADEIHAVGLYGNPVALSTSAGRSLVPLGPDPIFIDDVDAELLLFQSGAHIEPGFVVSRAARRELELVLTNPWPVTVTGRVRITGPEHWRLAPRVQQVVIAPGETARLGFETSLGVAEEAGVHALTVEAELTVGRELILLTLEPTVEIGIEDITLDGAVRVIPGPGDRPGDVLVIAVVTNVGDAPATMLLTALSPGFPRKQAPISTLAPGDSTVRQFRFENAAGALAGGRIRLSLSGTQGAERLNKTVTVPGAAGP